MGKLAEAYVDVTARLDTLPGGLHKAEGMVKSFVAGTGGLLGKAMLGGLALGGAGGIAGLGGGILAATKHAADLGETMSKVKTIFGGSADGVVSQADDLAAKFGVVKQSSLDAASAFGLMGRAAGLSQEQQAGLGKEMVQLGLDIASFHNISNDDAFLRLRSGLAGEAEPLRPLGILLSEDAVKAEALAMGLVKVKRELTEQEKVLARVSLIRRQAGPAVGDLARTADSAANQMRRLEGELINSATEFGARLIPALVEGVKLAHDIAEQIKGASPKAAIDKIGDAATEAVGQARLQAQHGPVKLLMAQLMDAAGLAGRQGIVGGWNQDLIDKDRRRKIDQLRDGGKFGEADRQAALLSDPEEARKAQAAGRKARRAAIRAHSEQVDADEKERGGNIRRGQFNGLQPGDFSVGGAGVEGVMGMVARERERRMLAAAPGLAEQANMNKDTRVEKWNDEIAAAKERIDAIRESEKGMSDEAKQAAKEKIKALEGYIDSLQDARQEAQRLADDEDRAAEKVRDDWEAAKKGVKDARENLADVKKDQAWDKEWDRTHGKGFSPQTFSSGADFARFAVQKQFERKDEDKGDAKQLKDANDKLDKANETLNKMLDKLGGARAG